MFAQTNDPLYNEVLAYTKIYHAKAQLKTPTLRLKLNYDGSSSITFLNKETENRFTIQFSQNKPTVVSAEQKQELLKMTFNKRKIHQISNLSNPFDTEIRQFLDKSRQDAKNNQSELLSSLAKEQLDEGFVFLLTENEFMYRIVDAIAAYEVGDPKGIDGFNNKQSVIYGEITKCSFDYRTGITQLTVTGVTTKVDYPFRVKRRFSTLNVGDYAFVANNGQLKICNKIGFTSPKLRREFNIISFTA